MACTLLIRGKRHNAKVLDVSSSGLSIRTELELAQGDEIEVVIEPALQLRAIAWRTTRTRAGFAVGMMLSEECSAYDTLVARHAVRQPAPAELARAPQAPAAPPPPPELAWRLHVKEIDGRRTRVVALAAPTRDEAIARGLAEIGGGWEVLDAKLAPREVAKPN